MPRSSTFCPYCDHIPRQTPLCVRLPLPAVTGLPLSAPLLLLFFFNDTAPTEIYTLSLHDALPISGECLGQVASQTMEAMRCTGAWPPRSEEHTSELQSRFDLVCRLLLEKKKKKTNKRNAMELRAICREHERLDSAHAIVYAKV